MWHNAQDAYLESRVLSAGPIGLVRLLYQGCSAAVEDARRHLAAGEIAARSRSISKAYQIMVELSGSLAHQHGGEISQRLAELYDYMQRRLIEANLQQSDAPLAEVCGLLATLAEAWEGISQPVASAAPATSPARSDNRWAQPLSEEPADNRWAQPLPEEPADNRWAQPLPEEPADYRWAQPRPQEPADNRWAQPLPEEPADNRWAQPLPEEPADYRWAQPLPQEPADNRWAQPLPQEPADNRWAQPLPEEPADNRWAQALPEEPADNRGAQPLPEEPAAAYASQAWSF